MVTPGSPIVEAQRSRDCGTIMLALAPASHKNHWRGRRPVRAMVARELPLASCLCCSWPLLVCLVWSAGQGRLQRPVGESGSSKRRGLAGLRPRAAPRSPFVSTHSGSRWPASWR